MKGTPKQIKKWKKNREQAYKGSIMHFIRSLYHENWEQEEFICRRLIRHPNSNRPSDSLINQKIKQFMPKNMQKGTMQTITIPSKTSPTGIGSVTHTNTQNFVPNPLQDSLNYWIEKRNLPKTVQYIENKNLTKADNIIIVAPQDTSLRKINLKSCLHVVYKTDKSSNLPAKSSVLVFNKPDVFLQKDGYVIENLDILYEGYLTEKKISNMLPLDFFVEEKKE